MRLLRKEKFNIRDNQPHGWQLNSQVRKHADSKQQTENVNKNVAL